MDCQDGVRNEKEETKAKRIFDECATKCVNKFGPVAPKVAEVICDQLEKLKKNDYK